MMVMDSLLLAIFFVASERWEFGAAFVYSWFSDLFG